jgi:hypothetical protein
MRLGMRSWGRIIHEYAPPPLRGLFKPFQTYPLMQDMEFTDLLRGLYRAF